MMNKIYLSEIVKIAVLEDIGYQLSPDSSLFGETRGKAYIEAQESGTLSGCPLVKEVFSQISDDVKIDFLKKDGDLIQKGTKICELSGKISDILSGERIALNFLQHMSAIATKTSNIVKRLPDSVRILDTRKTIPGLRALEKYSVQIGGGSNHRINLTDMVMVKTNHVRLFGGVSKAIERARDLFGHRLKIEVEVANIDEYKEALSSNPDIIMLDNFSPEDIKNMIILRKGKYPLLEASGGITENTILEYAETGIDLISMGALTHTVKAHSIHLVFE